MTAHSRSQTETEVIRADRTGFTLIEVMLSLVIGGMAVAASALLLLGLADRGSAIDASARRVDRAANAERLVRATVRNLQLSEDTTPPLKGTAKSARFHSWCDAAAGWPAPCYVHLFIRDTAGGQVLALELQRDDSRARVEGRPDDVVVLDLQRARKYAELLYLVDPGHGGEWIDHWSERMAPVAMAVAIDGDTLILPVRE
jgi:prepilin-type N-terminal cleavage/methylation domain-containing protein